MKFLYKLGSYLIFIRKAFSRPEKRSVYTKEVIVEFEKLGLNSIVLVVIISFFIGAVLTLQTAYNMQSPLLPRYLIGYLTREYEDYRADRSFGNHGSQFGFLFGGTEDLGFSGD